MWSPTAALKNAKRSLPMNMRPIPGPVDRSRLTVQPLDQAATCGPRINLPGKAPVATPFS